MQALKFALVSALALLGLSVVVKAGGYGHNYNYGAAMMPQMYYTMQVPQYQYMQYAAVPTYYGAGGVGFGGGSLFGGGMGGLIFLIMIIVVVLFFIDDDDK